MIIQNSYGNKSIKSMFVDNALDNASDKGLSDKVCHMIKFFNWPLCSHLQYAQAMAWHQLSTT